MAVCGKGGQIMWVVHSGALREIRRFWTSQENEPDEDEQPEAHGLAAQKVEED
jgi:hypothetical protein